MQASVLVIVGLSLSVFLRTIISFEMNIYSIQNNRTATFVNVVSVFADGGAAV